MAKPHSSNFKSSTQSNHRAAMDFLPNVLASCYSVNAATASLQGFHYSTTRAGVFKGPSGVPEVGLGNKAPPTSPLLATSYTQARGSKSSGNRVGEAVQTIAGGCERIFCETLRSTFLSEKDGVMQDSLAMGALDKEEEEEAMIFRGKSAAVVEWVEVWDYASDLASDLGPFRGFVAEKMNGERTSFVFFEPEVVPKELKPSLMALMELADIKAFGCSQLVVCISKEMEVASAQSLMRDLGWVGFEMATLANWTDGVAATSDEWLFLSIEI